jgi:hypothetical protein
VDQEACAWALRMFYGRCRLCLILCKQSTPCETGDQYNAEKRGKEGKSHTNLSEKRFLLLLYKETLSQA